MTSSFDPKPFLASLTTLPGVYQMLDAQGEVLYVGKARNLKDRVASYFRANLLDPKTVALVQQIQQINITITHNENEALLLESNLIKSLQPKYNILLRDDKSYPYLFLSAHPDFPRLDFHRGPQREKGEYYGPYPSAGAVHETLDLLQKLFKIRQCSDAFFKSRTRPCLQYQIKRCTAPCVGYINPPEYQINVQLARLFLQGKSDAVIKNLLDKMEQAASQLHFEQAALYRDLVRRMRDMQARQYVTAKTGDIDVIAIARQGTIICIEVMYIRGGRLLGDKSYFPKTLLDVIDEEALSAFLPQYYLSASRGESFPNQILINQTLSEKGWIEAALSQQLGRNISISTPVRGKPLQWMRMALLNARHSLANHLSNQVQYYQWLEALQNELHLANVPQRVECFDISHTSGEATVASCVVFGSEGPLKEDYRRFNITGITPGDDYAAMRQVLMRHYTRIKGQGAPLPDLLLIDGGKGQLAQAEAVLEELQVSGVILLGVAKGLGRKPGLEKLYRAGNPSPIILSPHSMALHLIQRIRDEAHRFAITGHRQQRAKARSTSHLEDIPNIGPKRRRELLRHFGGLQGVMRASVEELAKVPHISESLAKRIYEALHGG
jgi:excinuclease ABC subunit C